MADVTPFHFMQLADTQFGMFAHFSGRTDDEVEAYHRRGIFIRKAPKMDGFAPETALFEKAIAEANRLRPAFVVVCGDMIHDPWSTEQAAEVRRIAGLLDPGIPIHWVAGNHDIGADTVTPTPESIARYRENFGPDYYAFQHGNASFIVVDSVVLDRPESVPDELEAQMDFLRSELQAATARRSRHIIVFSHHPFFLLRADEPDDYWNIPLERRLPVLDMFREYGVRAVFAGHWHRNNYARDGGLEMVTSGAAGYPLGDDPSGYRIVRLYEDRMEHDYHGLDAGPERVDLGT